MNYITEVKNNIMTIEGFTIDGKKYGLKDGKIIFYDDKKFNIEQVRKVYCRICDIDCVLDIFIWCIHEPITFIIDDDPRPANKLLEILKNKGIEVIYQ